MKHPWAGALTIALGVSAGGAHAADQGGKCDITLDVTDKDPNGLNVRATPSASGKILTALKLGKSGDYIEVHVTAQAGDWYAIDSAVVYNDINDEHDTTTPDEQTIFHGHGFVHKSKVGGSSMDGVSELRDAPSDGAKILLKDFGGDDTADTSYQILGCEGQWYKLHIRGKTGWSKDVCTNERTTCV